MGRTLLIISFLLTLYACRQDSPKEVYLKQPTLEPLNNYSNNNFDEAFFNNRYYSFKEFVEVDTNGKFKFVYPDGTINNELLDTIKYYHTAETIIRVDTTEFYLRNCDATISNDTLNLVLGDRPFSQSLYELSVTKIKTPFYFKYYQTFSILDSSYILPVFSIIDQKIILDKQEYKKGDSIKGKIAVSVSAYHTWDTIYTDTVKIYGLIKTIVQ